MRPKTKYSRLPVLTGAKKILAALCFTALPQFAYGQDLSMPATNIISIGTPRRKLDSLVGVATFRSDIICLGRSELNYEDGMKVFLFNGSVVSVSPGDAAIGDPSHGYILERNGKKVFIDPAVVNGVSLADNLLERKAEVEADPLYAPPNHGVTEGIAPRFPSFSRPTIFPLHQVRSYSYDY